MELFTQLNLLRPKLFPGAVKFGLRYCEGKKTHFGYNFQGSSNMQELKLLLEET